MHTDMLLALANDHHRQLIAEGDRARLLSSARQARRSRKAQAVRGKPTDARPSRAPSAAAPAR